MTGSAKYREIERARDAIVERHMAQLKRFPNVRLSFWAFSQYKTCPQKYIMQCVGRDVKTRRDNFWAINGSVVHSLWEDFVERLKEDELDWDDAGEFLTDNVEPYYDRFVGDGSEINWDGNQSTPQMHKKFSMPHIRGSITFLHDELKAQGLIPRDPATIFSEYSFVTPLGNAPVELSGRTDLIFENPADIVIVDPKDVAKRGNVDWRQLIWYTLGLEPIFEKPVSRAGFLLTQLRDWSWRNPDAKNYRQDLTKEILETALKIRREPFKANVSRFHCPRCDVKNLCPEWKRYSERSDILQTDILGLDEGSVSI